MLLSARRSFVALALLSAACGGGATKPAETPAAPPAASAVEPREPAPDLSPVGAPAGLFAVGRWQHSLAAVDTLGGWLGIPGHVLDFVPERYQGLVQAVDTDAPVEFAAVLTRAKGSPVDWVASIGVKSLAQAVEEARNHGAEVEQKGPGIVALSLGRTAPTCAVALSLGHAPARLVCSSSERSLYNQLPFATRGLPTMPLGSRELEFELRLAPIRDGYQKELAAAPGFATFFARQLEIDAPRVDRATSDALKAALEEALQLLSDVDVVAAGGAVDTTKSELVLDFDLRFRDHKSSTATFLQDESRQGPPPEGFFSLPGNAESGGYSKGFDPKTLDGFQARLAEIVDALLEHEKVGRPSRERARHVIDAYFDLSGARSVANGPVASGASASNAGGFTLQIIENPSKPVIQSITDMNALSGDRQLRAAVAKRLGLHEKSLPKASMVPLKGPGVPAGTRALVVKLPKEFYDGLQQLLASKSLGSNKSRGVEPPELTFAAVPRGEGTVLVMTPTAADASKVLGDFFSGKTPTLKERPELLRLERLNAAGAYFMTLGGLVSAVAQTTGNATLKASGPSANAPLFLRYEIQKGTTRFGLSVPKSLFAGLQQLVPMLIK